MARFPVDVQLEVLALVEEAPPGLVDGGVAGVLLGEQVPVLPVVDGRLDLDDLALDRLPDGVRVAPAALAASLAQARLHHARGRL